MINSLQTLIFFDLPIVITQYINSIIKSSKIVLKLKLHPKVTYLLKRTIYNIQEIVLGNFYWNCKEKFSSKNPILYQITSEKTENCWAMSINNKFSERIFWIFSSADYHKYFKAYGNSIFFYNLLLRLLLDSFHLHIKYICSLYCAFTFSSRFKPG